MYSNERLNGDRLAMQINLLVRTAVLEVVYKLFTAPHLSSYEWREMAKNRMGLVSDGYSPWNDAALRDLIDLVGLTKARLMLEHALDNVVELGNVAVQVFIGNQAGDARTLVFVNPNLRNPYRT